MLKANYWMTKRIQEIKEYLYQVFFGKSESYKVKILGIILFTIGVILFFVFFDPFTFLLWVLYDTPNFGLNYIYDNFNFITISIILIFFGLFIFLFFPENNTKNNKEIYIFFFLAGWLIIMSFIAPNKESPFLLNGLDYFCLFIVFGILICKELANGYITPRLRKRLSILSLGFFSLSMIVIAIKVYSFFKVG
jgi:hypothetical protein